MTALAADSSRTRRSEHLLRRGAIVGADSQTFFQGSMVCHDGAGAIAVGADTVLFTIAGVTPEARTTGASNADLVEFEFGHEELFTHDGNIAVTDVGRNATLLDDNTLSNAATTTNDISVGIITERVSATQAWVAIGVFTDSAA